MSDTNACPKCGNPLPADAPGGLCPECLLRAGLDTETRPQQVSGSADTAATTHRSARGFVPPTVEEIAQRFPQLEILGLLGKGGMGAVYKARQPGLDRLVAVKVLPPDVGDDPSFAERFTREARALARLGHPNIVAIHDFGRAGGLFYFIMEYVNGASLRQAIATGKMTPPEALAVIPQICDALQYAHDEGVVHRDIKPDNILLDTKGRVKIADFGLSKLLSPDAIDMTLTQEHHVMGTPAYMAPEQQKSSAAVDHRADIYSLGVVFYEMLTGERPMGRFEPPSKRVQIDVRLDEIVLHALEREPALRYQQASQIKTDVEQVRIGALSPQIAAVALHRALGREYKSKATLFGLPLLHVATGIDPETGKKRVAKGIIALGDVAIGVFAAGGVAVGGVAFGGVSIGLVSIGGTALGLLLSIGGLAVAIGAAFGGLAVGSVAIGGMAAGYYAAGGGAWGAHFISGNHTDAAAKAFFAGWAERWPAWLALVGMAVPLGGALLAACMWIALRSGSSTSGWDETDTQSAGGLR